MASLPNILARIIEQKKLEVAKLKQSFNYADANTVIRQLPASKDLLANLKAKQQNQQPGIIAEIKKASPSLGIIREDFDPIAILEEYERINAAAISVLTDEKFFQGSENYLRAVRAKTELPILRKDFIIDEVQIYQSRMLQSDCILLIAACLDEVQLNDFTALAHELDLQVLVEVHNFSELEKALMLPTPLLGINNRDLTTFKTAIETSLELKKEVPSDKTVISESGIHHAADVKRLQVTGINAFLIGETFMRAETIQQAYEELFT
ncbi:MAG: indole-3-glycerol phosphate synthase TrpC [Pseudomonadota bacterium]